MSIPVYSIKIPGYSVRKKPDHAGIGEKIDKVIKKHFLGQRLDFFALDFRITKNSRFLENFIEPFYTYPKAEGKKTIRIDIIILYDLAKLKRVPHRYEGRKDIKRDGFVFRDQAKKKDALAGI